MRHLLIFCLFVVLLSAACSNNKKTEQQTTTTEDGSDKNSSQSGTANMTAATEEMQKQAEALQKLPPLSLDQLKSLLPETMMSAKRTNYQTTTATGTGLAQAEYKINDSTEMKVTIWDCGGPAGAGIYNMQYMTMFNYQQESETEYTKTVDFKGQKAFEHCNKTNNRCTLTYFDGKRFLVTIEGHNVHPDGLKQGANELNLQG